MVSSTAPARPTNQHTVGDGADPCAVICTPLGSADVCAASIGRSRRSAGDVPADGGTGARLSAAAALRNACGSARSRRSAAGFARLHQCCRPCASTRREPPSRAAALASCRAIGQLVRVALILARDGAFCRRRAAACFRWRWRRWRRGVARLRRWRFAAPTCCIAFGWIGAAVIDRSGTTIHNVDGGDAPAAIGASHQRHKRTGLALFAATAGRGACHRADQRLAPRATRDVRFRHRHRCASSPPSIQAASVSASRQAGVIGASWRAAELMLQRLFQTRDRDRGRRSRQVLTHRTIGLGFLAARPRDRASLPGRSPASSRSGWRNIP